MFFSRLMMAMALTFQAVPAAADGGGGADAGAALAVAPSGTDGGVADAGVARPPMAPDVKALVDRVQAFYEQTQDFTADFKQEYTYKAFKRTQTSSGTVTFRKPALMRWEYTKPSPRTFVLAGNRVFAHDPEAKLLTRAALSTNQLSASVTFLWGQGRLADEFSIVKKACAKCTGTQLELTPLVADPRFKRILLEVDERTAMVVKSTVIDPDGSENAISFLGLKTNVGIDEAHFRLTPPPGTQVQDFLSGQQLTVPGADAGVR
jgi:outer membrane lipoprotein carrier protein